MTSRYFGGNFFYDRQFNVDGRSIKLCFQLDGWLCLLFIICKLVVKLTFEWDFYRI